ncbi:MAG TPA: ABC transporter permease [Vicinamibacterales bacterium]|nr:ABC transporter permease [Vicinamibacterales bacterium]
MPDRATDVAPYRRSLSRHRREIWVAAAIALLFVALGIARPEYFSRGNLTDLFLANFAVLIIAAGMTLVVLTGDIDISVGSLFAVCAVSAGVLAKAGFPTPLVFVLICVLGALAGTLNGSLVAFLRLPSIVVSLAMMIVLRDALRWITQGAWVQNLPPTFQWMGLSQAAYPFAAGAAAVFVVGTLAWGLRYTAAGRLIYATGSSRDAARLAGVKASLVTLSVFATLGALTGLAAVLNAMRFNQVPANTGLGLELKVIAAVLVGGTSITGGRGTILGTVLGVALLGAIGPALTFLGVSAYWERAIQGAIILVAVAADAVPRISHRYAVLRHARA